jgi:hypothetical protein
MTTFPPASYRPRRWVFPRHALLMACLGGGIGTITALGLYISKTAYVALIPFGLTLLLPTFFLRNFRLYWFAIFLYSTQFEIKKNLNDGLAVIDGLNIDYTIWNFTFDVTATDLVLLILLAIWANDLRFNGKHMGIPRTGWLALGYLGICLISILGAASPYLGFVELSRQIKFFIVYLFAANCLDSKNAVRVLVIVGVMILATQAGMTVARFETGYMTPLTFGDTFQSLSQINEYLAVDRSTEGSTVRAYGTLASPGSTVRLCMMVIPFALFLCVRNPLFGMRLAFAVLTAFGLTGLLLTFDRAFYITTAVQSVLVFLIMLRDRMLRPEAAVLIVLLALAGAAAVSHPLYQQFTVREDSMSVRFRQYEAAANMIFDHPLLGVGLNNGTGEKRNYVDVTYNPRDPETRFYVEPTHNLYLSLASEIGIPGVLLFVAFFARAAGLAWRLSRRSTDPEIRWLANALVVVFCGVAMNGLMDPLQEYSVLVFLWLYAGLTVGLTRMAQGKGSPKPELATAG